MGVETRLLEVRAASVDVDRAMVTQDLRRLLGLRLGGADRQQRAAAAHRLRVDVGLALGHADAGERTDQAADRRACRGSDARAGERRHQRAGGDDRTDARDQDDPEARQETDRAADAGADHRARARATLRTFSHRVPAVLAVGSLAGHRGSRELAARVVGSDADVVAVEVAGHQGLERGLGRAEIVEQTDDGLHGVSPRLIVGGGGGGRPAADRSIVTASARSAMSWVSTRSLRRTRMCSSSRSTRRFSTTSTSSSTG